MDLSINGSAMTNLVFPASGAWTTWAGQPADTVALSAGLVTIRVTATTSGGAPNMDKMDITIRGGVIVAPTETPEPTPTPEPTDLPPDWTPTPIPQDPILLEEYLYIEADFPSVHAADLLELENGDLLCTFFGGSREGDSDVEIRLCRKPFGATEWTPPISAADGNGRTCYNPVFCYPRGSGIIYIYFCSPGINDGKVTNSTDNGYTWCEEYPHPNGLVGPIVNKPIQLDDGSILAGSSTESGGWRVHVERSTDNGVSWYKIGPLDGDGVIQPTFLVHSQTRIQMLMRCGSHDDDTKIPQAWSEDGGLTWSSVTNTTLPNNSSGIDAVTLKDGRHLLAYNHSTRNMEGTGRKGRGIMTVALTLDGINWEAALVLDYRDYGDEQYSYPAVIQTRDGLVHVAYSWHRKRIKHVVINPDALVTYPIINGEWPKDKIPWIESDE
jgi:predicted neuraminidase